MTEPTPPPPDRERTKSLTLGVIALIPMTLILLLTAVTTIGVSGASTMAAVLPLFALVFTGWIWLILGVIALVIGLGARRRRLPLTIASIALTEIIASLLLLLSVRS